MDKHIEELLPLYALGGLNADEKTEVDAYVAANPQARADLDELLQVTSALAFSGPPMPPAPEVKSALLHRVNAGSYQRRAEQAQVTGPVSPGREPRPGLFDWLRSQAAGLALAGVMLIIIFFVGGWALGLNQTVGNQNEQLAALEAANAQLTGRVDQLETQVTALEAENDDLRDNNQLLAGANANQTAELGNLNLQFSSLESENQFLAGTISGLQTENEELAAALALLAEENAGLSDVVAVYESLLGEDAVVTTLQGTEARPDAVAQLVTSADGETGFLVVSGLDPLAEGLAYQVLLIYDEGHDTAETFLVDTSGHGVSLVSSDGSLLENYTAVGVSIEPEGGSPQRTGDIVLLGTIGS